VDGNTGEETYEEQESQHHGLGEGGYSCELKLKRNALGKDAGRKSDEAKARQNDQEAPPGPKVESPSMATVHANAGEERSLGTYLAERRTRGSNRC